MTSSYLVFRLSERFFGVKLLGAIEIVPWRAPRPVPLSYPHIAGLIDYRGTLYPVIELGRRLGMNKQEPIGFAAGNPEQTNSGQSIILLEEKRTRFGIIVDVVVKMTTLEEPTMAPETTPGVDPKYVKGIVFEDDQEILILDFERLLHAS